MRSAPILFLFLLTAGCTDKNSQPSDILPRDKMEKVVLGLIQADQYADLFLAKDSARINVRAETQKLYQQVFLLQQVSTDDFRKSFQYYLDRPDKSKNLFDSLLAKANRMRSDYYSVSHAHPGIGVAPPPPAAPPPQTVTPSTHPVTPPTHPLTSPASRLRVLKNKKLVP